MKTLFFSFIFICAAYICNAQKVDTMQMGDKTYYMTTYYMGFLKKGDKWTAEKTPETAKIQEGHMAHISKMADEGKLAIAGPFLDNWDVRGVFIFNVATIEEAIALCEADPAVKAGRLKVEVHPWYAAKGSKLP